jgi:hypothetical protein
MNPVSNNLPNSGKHSLMDKYELKVKTFLLFLISLLFFFFFAIFFPPFFINLVY